MVQTDDHLAKQHAKSPSTLIYHSISLDSGGYLSPVSWDKHSGEGLLNSVRLPTNVAWIYSDAFISIQPQKDYVIVEFKRSFKVFSVASDRDLILLIEQYI